MKMAQIVFTVDVDAENLQLAQFAAHKLGWNTADVNSTQLLVMAPISTFVGQRPTLARAQAKFWEQFADDLDWESHEF